MQGQAPYVRGIVRDSLTMQALPYASVSVVGMPGGAVTDERGFFELKVPRGAKALSASVLGYRKSVQPLRFNGINLYDFQLTPEATELGELVVTRGKYSKRNNPAVDFMQRLRESCAGKDPRNAPDYNRRDYERITLALNNFAPDEESAVLRRFPFLKAHIDTSEVSGRPLLPLSVKEKVSERHWRGSDNERRVVTGLRRQGVDEMMDQENVLVALEDMLGEVDLADNDINLLQNRFVSPLSRIAPDFYRFYLVDTLAIDGDSCAVLAFYPRNKASFGFNGRIYVSLEDSTMFVRRAELRTPGDINLNFINSLLLTQNFRRGPDGTQLKTTDDLVLEARMLPGTPEIYIRRLLQISDHNFTPAPDSIFSGLGAERQSAGATARDSVFWLNARHTPIPQGEDKLDLLVRRLRQNKFYYWGEKGLKILFGGYVPTGSPSRFDIGPVNTLVSYNELEGVRVRLGGMTTAALSRHWFARVYGAYGFRDHRWKYKAELEYSFNAKQYHSREWPVNSLRFTHSYDIDRPGEHYLFTNPDNFVLSWRRMSDPTTVYRRLTKLEYTLELRNNLSILAAVSNRRFEPSRLLPLTLASGQALSHFTENILTVQLRYAPGEKFYQTKSYRIPVNLDAPVFVLEHSWAPSGFCGSRWGINKTEFNFSKRFWLSAFGYIDAMAGAGHVWGKTDYLDLLIPNVNLSYTIQPQSYSLMSPLEFINSSYVSWDITYWLNGALFNLVPGLKKARLREVVAFRGLYGERRACFDPGPENADLLAFPADVPARKMDQGPYMEISAGLDNILKVLRVDYVWRLSYRHTPYPIDRSGLRVALHVTF